MASSVGSISPPFESAAAPAPPAVAAPAPAATPVADRCATALLLAGQLRGAADIGDADDVRRRVRDLVDRAEGDVRAAGLGAADAEDVAFALVAALDEAVIRSAWRHKDAWRARPMQFDRFQRYDAGEEFFTRLDRVRQERVVRADVLEVYYLCLALGFKGKYQVRPDAEWRALVADVGAQLRRERAARPGRLSPNGVGAEELHVAVREVPLWVVAAAVATVAVLIYLVLTGLVTSQVNAVERFAAGA